MMRYLQATIALLTATFLAIAGYLFFSRQPVIITDEVAQTIPPLPKGAFVRVEEAYCQIDRPFLEIAYSTPVVQVPDLKILFSYYGKNGRPDANTEEPLFHVGFNGQKVAVSVPADQKIYLIYDRQLSPCKFAFSPNNQPTIMWLELQPNGIEINVKVALDVADVGLQESEFQMGEKEYQRFAGGAWEIGRWRVDGTLLARQRARWFGADAFLERHGGEEFETCAGRQRVDFGEEPDFYSVFVKANDCLSWDGTQWNLVEPGEKSRGTPLMVVRKIDDRLMNFELWDTEGKGKITLNLLKANEAAAPTNVVDAFHFVGARTKSQFVFEVNDERLLIRPEDWLVLNEGIWHKLTTPEEIDAYVNRQITGPLFVVEDVGRKEDRQVLMGTVYNASRSQAQSVEIAMQPHGSGTPAGPDAKMGDGIRKEMARPQRKLPQRSLFVEEEQETSVATQD